MIGRLRNAAGLSALILVVVTGCSPGTVEDPTAATSQETALAEAAPEVSPTGGELAASLGNIRAVPAAGALPPGAELRLTPAVLPEIPGDLQLSALGEAFDISITDGSQPQQLVEVSIPEPELAEDEHVVFLYQDENAIWRWLPVTVQAERATVQMDHFSLGFFGRFRLDGSFRDAALRYLGQTYAEPGCLGPPVILDGREFTVESGSDAIRACVNVRDERIHVEVHSNSGLVWRARGVPGELTPRSDAAPGTASGELVRLMHKADPRAVDAEMVLPPGSWISYQLSDGVQASYIDLQADAALGLLAPLLGGVQMLVGVAGGGASAALDTAQCGAGLITLPEPEAELVSWLASITPSLIDCLITQLEESHPMSSAVSMALAVVASLPGLFASQVVGLVNEVGGHNDGRVVLSSDQVPLSLTWDAVGDAPLGLPLDEQRQVLAEVLGEPGEVVEREGCFLGGPDWKHHGLRWGNFYLYGEGYASELVLDAWSLTAAGHDGPRAVQPPHGTYVGMSSEEVLASVPGANLYSDPMFGDRIEGPEGVSWDIRDGEVIAIRGGGVYYCE